jgi:hypothetical protein
MYVITRLFNPDFYRIFHKKNEDEIHYFKKRLYRYKKLICPISLRCDEKLLSIELAMKMKYRMVKLAKL